MASDRSMNFSGLDASPCIMTIGILFLLYGSAR